MQAIKYDKTTDSPLISFLIKRAVENFELGDYFYWYLTVEASLKSSKHSKFYEKVLNLYTSTMQQVFISGQF